MAIAEIDVRGGIEAAQAGSKGHRLWRDRRPETYTRISAPAEI